MDCKIKYKKKTICHTDDPGTVQKLDCWDREFESR